MRRFFRQQISGSHGNVERWRRGLGVDRQNAVDARYQTVLEAFERDSINGNRMLKRVYAARSQA